MKVPMSSLQQYVIIMHMISTLNSPHRQKYDAQFIFMFLKKNLRQLYFYAIETI